jgi:hypothetical protein
VKTGLKTRAHGDLTLILPLNVDTRRIESLPRAATGADHQPPDAAPDGHAPRNGVRADAEVARDGPARRRRQRLGRIVVGRSPAWGQTTRTEDPATGSENRVREPPCHPRGGHRRTPPRSLETPMDQIQGVPARARSFRPGVTEVAPTPMGTAQVPGLRSNRRAVCGGVHCPRHEVGDARSGSIGCPRLCRPPGSSCCPGRSRPDPTVC